MRLLEVNGHSLLGASHQDAVNVLRNAGNEIQLVVCKGYDKSSLMHSIGQAGGMSTGFNSSASCSGGSRQGESNITIKSNINFEDQFYRLSCIRNGFGIESQPKRIELGSR